jgi:hypothetical protein
VIILTVGTAVFQRPFWLSENKGEKKMTEMEITGKNTKAEILDALNKALLRAEAAEKGKLNPEKTEKERVEKKAIETTKSAVEQNIFSKELIDKFNDLQVAIAAEERRLQELYGVGRELQKLALIIEAEKERLAAIAAYTEARRAGGKPVEIAPQWVLDMLNKS